MTKTILNLPVNAGIIGTLVAPWGVIAGIIAAFGFKCKIELTKDDGTVIDISRRAEAIGKEVMEKGLRGSRRCGGERKRWLWAMPSKKATAAYNNVKDAATEKINELKTKKEDAREDSEDDQPGDMAERSLGIYRKTDSV